MVKAIASVDTSFIFIDDFNQVELPSRRLAKGIYGGMVGRGKNCRRFGLINSDGII
jgi:hypothetical protein